MGKRNPDPLEKDIERTVKDYAREKGMLAYKFTSPARAAVPDDLFVTPKGVVWFCEFKRKGQKPTLAQEREHHRLRKHQVAVHVVDNIDTGKMLIDSYVEKENDNADPIETPVWLR